MYQLAVNKALMEFSEDDEDYDDDPFDEEPFDEELEQPARTRNRPKREAEVTSM